MCQIYCLKCAEYYNDSAFGLLRTLCLGENCCFCLVLFRMYNHKHLTTESLRLLPGEPEQM